MYPLEGAQYVFFRESRAPPFTPHYFNYAPAGVGGGGASGAIRCGRQERKERILMSDMIIYTTPATPAPM